MAVAFEFAAGAAEENDGQRVVVVLVAVTHAAAVENHRVIEQRSVAVLGGGELVDEVGEHGDVVLVDQGEVVHVRFVVGMVRGAVETAAVGTFGERRGTEVFRVHQRRDARDIALVGQREQVVHQLDVYVEGFGCAYGRVG